MRFFKSEPVRYLALLFCVLSICATFVICTSIRVRSNRYVTTSANGRVYIIDKFTGSASYLKGVSLYPVEHKPPTSRTGYNPDHNYYAD